MFTLKISHSNKTDIELLQLYKKSGSTDYLAILFERYFHLIYGACIKHLENNENAKDVCMEIYELLSVKLKTHEVTHFKSWLYRVTFNQCMQFLRKSITEEKKSKAFQLDMDEDVEFDLFNHPSIDKEILLNHLEDCIEQLKAEQATSIRLFYLKQSCYNEIVEQTGYALKKVKSYIQNGKRNLKICIDSKSE